MGEPDARAGHAAAEAVARRSYGKLIALLSARTRDLAAAEDALADAFAAALADWPRHGIPQTPEAWLLTAARRRLIDGARARRTHDGAADTLRLLGEWAQAATDPAGPRAEIPDHRLALMFDCAHPAIAAGMRAPLMLQTLLGFDAAAIGSAFLVAPATMGQRLVRAKSRIRETGIAFAVPPLAALGDRLDAVLDAVYACYAEGWSDPAGADAHRRNLAEETQGPAPALAALDALAGDARLADYQPYWAARAGLLQRLGQAEAADAAYARAIGLESDPAVRAFLQQRRTAPLG